MPSSTFEGTQLLPKIPRYASPDERLRLNSEPADRFRAIIDGWVAGDSDASRAKTRSDLLDRNTSVGTFHELLLREVLRRKYGAIEREPHGLPVGDKNPDYAIRIGRRGDQPNLGVCIQLLCESCPVGVATDLST